MSNRQKFQRLVFEYINIHLFFKQKSAEKSLASGGPSDKHAVFNAFLEQLHVLLESDQNGIIKTSLKQI